MPVIIYIDGACRDNPGRGGWAFVIVQNGATIERSGADPETTNNRMELRAAIEAISTLSQASEVLVNSDSEYLISGMTSRIHHWKLNGWKTKDGGPVKNRDLWDQLDRLRRIHSVKWQSRPGQSDDPDRKRCHQLAIQQAGIMPDEQPGRHGRRYRTPSPQAQSSKQQRKSRSKSSRQPESPAKLGSVRDLERLADDMQVSVPDLIDQISGDSETRRPE